MLFSRTQAGIMKRFLIVPALLALAFAPIDARADDPPPAAQPSCGLANGLMASQDQGTVTIICEPMSEAAGTQLGDILNRILMNRLDPQSVLVKLEEIAPIPPEGVARILDDNQRQVVVQQLVGKPAEQVAIIAHPSVADSGDYAKSIAAPLLMVGWQIEGNQIRRAAPKALDVVRGIALMVRDAASPPEKATRLKAALSAAKVMVPLVSDPSMPPEATTLWIGKRPTLFGFAQKP